MNNRFDCSNPMKVNRCMLRVIVLVGAFWLAAAISASAQRRYVADFPRDTSYTTQSTYVKLLTSYPFIQIPSITLPRDLELIENLIYKKIRQGYSGTRALRLDVVKPVNATSLPVILILHGGGWRSGHKEMSLPMAIRLASYGFACIMVEYRLSAEALYPAAVHDVRDAVRFVKAGAVKLGINPKKIALLGCSAGGSLAALVGTTPYKLWPEGSDINNAFTVNAVINVDGVVDMTDPAESGKDNDPAKPSSGSLWFGATYAMAPQKWMQASALSHVSNKTPPMLFVNSAVQRFRAGRDNMISSLRSYGILAKVCELPDTPHSFWLFDPWLDPAVECVVSFLNQIFTD